jgi:phosphatidylglycerophosphate synthase
VLIACAVSDFLDGYLARKLQAESKLGTILDPVADKVFLNSALWGLLIYHEFNPWLLVISIAVSLRDLTLLAVGGSAIVTRKFVDIKPIYLSKICTTLVFILCALMLTLDSKATLLKVLNPLCLLCVAITATEYARRFMKARNPA